MVVDDKKSQFNQIEVLDLQYYYFFCTTNSMGCQPAIFQRCLFFAPQTLTLAATAIEFAFSGYTR
jgi:hypothetical protein